MSVPNADQNFRAPSLPPRRSGVTPIPINQIQPDPEQPRRVVPTDFRHRSIDKSIDNWIKSQWGEFEEIAKALFDNKKKDPPRPDNLTPEGQAFLSFLELAASIYRTGLANPITVTVIKQDSYQVETGERRLYAYHLLNAWFPDDPRNWSAIPARVVDKPDVWRQAAENAARANLNAIAKARQFAILMMDLYRETNSFEPLESFPHEREFYVRGDLDMPYGKRDQVLAAMGFKSPAEITRCRSVLHLPNEVWQLADDRNVPQSVVEQCFGKSKDEALQIVSSWNGFSQDIKKQGKKSGAKNRSPVNKADDLIAKTRAEYIKAKSPERRQIKARLRALLDELENL